MMYIAFSVYVFSVVIYHIGRVDQFLRANVPRAYGIYGQTQIARVIKIKKK